MVARQQRATAQTTREQHMTSNVTSIIRTQAALLAHDTRRANARKLSRAARKAWETRRANAAKLSNAARKAWDTRRATAEAIALALAHAVFARVPANIGAFARVPFAA
jgi:hypothetical protein